MNALFALWRIKEWSGARTRGLRSEAKEGEGGWPDKRAAIGVGAGHWNNGVISAVSRVLLLAHGEFFLMKSMQIAPSAAFIHSARLALR